MGMCKFLLRHVQILLLPLDNRGIDHDVALRRTLSSIPEQLCWHRYVNLKVILIITKHTRNNVRTHCIVNMHLVGIAGDKSLSIYNSLTWYTTF